MSDIRALLVTDVVDSTRLSEALGDAATAELWAAHDRLARSLLRGWRGREIDKTDGLLVLFDSAIDAVGCALAYHRALAALDPPLAARAGLHVGPVILRENSAADRALGAKPLEVEGIGKAIAVRVMSIARGGQTLLTDDARTALGASPLRLQSHGHWRLKGLTAPLELFEAGDADSPFLPPPPDSAKAYRVVRQGEHWLPVQQIRHNLPAERDAFVGRQQPLVELARRFDAGARLVSVLGIGGTGKTRLATHFAWTWLGDFPGGAWFCDLSQARDADDIVRAVAEALDVPLGREDPVVQLGHAIAGRGHCLMILDNFEQVARHAEETLGRWLGRAGEATFIATTREVLGLAGEESLALAPLPMPDAATLFRRRAQAARRDFAPTADDEAAIGPLVKLLDGLPLAIELAAARVRVMPPRTLLARMSERFKLLASSGGRHDRQATLRATLDWSWDQLSAGDKAALAQLSVFEAGFTLESAEAVVDLSQTAGAPWPVDVMQSLVEKSLVRPVTDRRFDLLTSVQEYAAEHLGTPGRFAGSGPAALVAAQARHGNHFAGLGEKEAIAGGCAELDNLAAACRRAVRRGDSAVAVGALEGAWAALRLRGPFRSGVELAMAVRSMSGLDAAAISRSERIGASALQATGRVADADARFAAGLALAREIGDRRLLAQLLTDVGHLHADEGRMDEARAEHTAALALACEVGDATLESDAHRGLGTLLDYLGEIEEARLHYEAARTVARESGDRRREGGMLGNLGLLFANQGRLDEAESHFEASLKVAREVGDRQWEGNALSNLGLLHHLQGRMTDARDRLDAALIVARELGHVRLECIVRCNLGIVNDALGRRLEAGSHYEAALALARDLGDRRTEGQTLGYLGVLHAREARHDEARRCLGAGEALLLALADRTSLALLLCGRAEAEQLAGSPVAARDALDRAEALAAETAAGPESELRLSLARLRELLEVSCG